MKTMGNPNDNLKYECLRRLKPCQRIQLAFELHEVARARVSGHIRRCHPDLSENELLEELNRRFLLKIPSRKEFVR